MNQAQDLLQNQINKFKTAEFRSSFLTQNHRQKMQIYNWLLTNQFESYRFNTISEDMFLSQVDTGDILLIRTNSNRFIGPWLTRAYTASHFDHIQIILRYGDSVRDLYILEAVGDRGVRMTTWNNIRSELYAGGFFDKIVTRKLIYEMTPQRLNDLDQFRRNCVGNSYGLSIKKLLKSHRSEQQLGSRQSNIEKTRTFFCSELIAKAFKVLGVMKDPDAKSCTSYFPGSFAPEAFGGCIDSELSDDVSLGPALNILVDARHELSKNHLLQDNNFEDSAFGNAQSRYYNWV